MKYKIEEGCKLYDQLQILRKKTNDAQKASYNLANEYGFKQWRCLSLKLSGGIESFYSKNKPDGFAFTYGSKEPNDFFPKKTKANKDLLQKIEKLPVVECEELNNIIKYDGFNSDEYNENGARRISFHPGIIFNKNNVLISIPEFIKYKPVKGMIEILESEYKKLSK